MNAGGLILDVCAVLHLDSYLLLSSSNMRTVLFCADSISFCPALITDQVSDINHVRMTAYYPQRNGQTERVNSSMEAYLRVYVHYTQDDWERFLDIAEFGLNDSVNATQSVTPFFAHHVRHPVIEIIREEPGEELIESSCAGSGRSHERCIRDINKQTSRSQENMRLNYNQDINTKSLMKENFSYYAP